MTRFQAQMKLGLFAPHDFVMGALIVFTWVATAFYWLFRPEPSLVWVLGALLLSALFLLVWLVVLAYRIMVFLLDIQADINLMPEAAARIALGYFQGRTPPK